jgi:hypothetical protein
MFGPPDTVEGRLKRYAAIAIALLVVAVLAFAVIASVS